MSGRRLALGAATAIAAVALVGLAHGQPGPRGYLALGSFDLMAVLPTAPATGDARDAADRAIFRATQRRFVGTPRWDLATNDVKLAPADLMRDFSCSVGVSLTPDNAPRTAALMTRIGADTFQATQAAKTFYARRRPFLVDPATRTCQSPEALRGSADYPSGHTTVGWTWATVLAGLVPDRATPILARGRAFGESRIVCGVHNYSAVEAGRVAVSATLAAMAGLPEFAADRAAARAEIDALRRKPQSTPPKACAREAELVALPILDASPGK